MLRRGRPIAVGLLLAAGFTAPSAHADAISSAFAAPARSQLPLYRFWNGGGSLDPATFNHELDEMAANATGGIEASTFSTQSAIDGPQLHDDGELRHAAVDAARHAADPGRQLAWAAGRRDLLAALVGEHQHDHARTGRARPRRSRSAAPGSTAARPTPARCRQPRCPAASAQRELLATLAYRCVSDVRRQRRRRCSTRARSSTSPARSPRRLGQLHRARGQRPVGGRSAPG